ncbi:MAG TPA: hypothetical protein VFA76_17280 [Terriglobales bacterium]|nr:hypothetical protein [Terriglobales bacterium]
MRLAVRCPAVHSRWFFSIGLVLSLTCIACADTIYFKNGTSIQIDKATEKDGKIEYFIGSTRYTIPQTSVQRVEHSGGLGISIGSSKQVSTIIATPDSGASAEDNPVEKRQIRPEKLRLPSPEVSAAEEKHLAELRYRILIADRVDEAGLAAVEHEGNAQQSMWANFEAGRFQLQHGDADDARKRFERALSFKPDLPTLLEWHIIACAQSNRYAEAIPSAEKLVKVLPEGWTFATLGQLYYNTDQKQQAIAALKRSLQFERVEVVQELMERAQHQLDVEGNFNQSDSWHFTLRYEGRATSLTLQRDLLGTLEEQYRDLARDLHYNPTENISVILYTSEQFFDITRAPSWVGALNDGTLRIPLGGITTVSPELQSVLKHELTHSFVRLMSAGRCPTWLNEGLAQLMQARTLSPSDNMALARLFGESKEAPFRLLEGSFVRFPAPVAAVAYAESLVAVQYLRSKYGMGGLQRLLTRIGEGESPEAALFAVTSDHYVEFEHDLSAYLQRGSGG